MKGLTLKIITILAAALTLMLSLSGCRASLTLKDQIDAVAAPYGFSVFDWEVKGLTQAVGQAITGADKAQPDQSQVVVDYFSVMDQINAEEQTIENISSGITSGDLTAALSELSSLEGQRDSLTAQAQYVLEAQVRATLNSLGIHNPLDTILGLKSTFPPVKLSLQEPPKLLVVSPLDSISRLATIPLNNDMSLQDITNLENAVSALGVSALVVDLGGIATYPSFVANRYGLQFALSTAVEEWCHQYLFFRPLGFRYGLEEAGFNEPDYIVTMNESLAGMVSDEVAGIIYNKYYASYYPPVTPSSGGSSSTGFNFDSFMHDTRVQVDSLLAQGQVTQAEAYMEQKRLILVANGYEIRKLNQAYFAFYGSYADQPGFEDPISTDLTTLRADSKTLAAFLNEASGFTNPGELASAVG
jgi:hypothetical protein